MTHITYITHISHRVKLIFEAYKKLIKFLYIEKANKYYKKNKENLQKEAHT